MMTIEMIFLIFLVNYFVGNSIIGFNGMEHINDENWKEQSEFLGRGQVMNNEIDDVLLIGRFFCEGY